MSIHPEGTLGRLRYSLGGDRPSQTTRLALSASPLQGRRVRAAANTEWYFTLASTAPKSTASLAPTYAPQRSLRLQATL